MRLKKSGRMELYLIGLIFIVAAIFFACAEGQNYRRPEGPIQEIITREIKTAQPSLEEILSFRAIKETLEKSASVSAVTRITDSPQIETFIKVSNDKNKLVFTVYDEDRNREGDIWTLNLSTQALTRVTNFPGDERSPCWTSDDKFIYFENTLLGKRCISKISAFESGGVMQITSGPNEYVPDFCAETKKVAFSLLSESAPAGFICTTESDGSQYTQLKEGYSPRWSPDGQKIIFVRWSKADKTEIWTMAADGSKQTQLTRGESRDLMPSFSLDGKYIVFASNRGKNKDFNIWVMKSDGSNLTQITLNESADLYPVFGATSKEIFFCSNRGGKWDIWKTIALIE